MGAFFESILDCQSRDSVSIFFFFITSDLCTWIKMNLEKWIERLQEVMDVAEELMEIVEESEERELVAERRQYKMMERITVDDWDDYDFVFRFRVSKATFHRVLDMVKADLDFTNNKIIINNE